MRKIAISDIHGCAAELDRLLEKTKAVAGEIIFLGDYVDTGPNSLDVAERVGEWCSQGATALLGNHDDLFLRWLEGKEIIYFYGKTGGIATINSFLDRIEFERVEYTQLLHDENKENDIRKRSKIIFSIRFPSCNPARYLNRNQILFLSMRESIRRKGWKKQLGQSFSIFGTNLFMNTMAKRR
ncbi:metallophosphoesterase [Neobacillus niacini]|uniref:metallophosphoesterase n=1 Tax=Neobacillus niacini TaxID=86668 RepID=UPI0021CB4A72|nr:metallophosphoesterase [Neobacillus niacini]MCM3765540.1 metallophosphoesterase [Neobacillus niacini]